METKSYERETAKKRTWSSVNKAKKEERKKWREINLEKKLEKQKVATNKIDQVSLAPKVLSTLSIAVPGSILENAQSPELRTYLAGQIARAACIFQVSFFQSGYMNILVCFAVRPTKLWFLMTIATSLVEKKPSLMATPRLDTVAYNWGGFYSFWNVPSICVKTFFQFTKT